MNNNYNILVRDTTVVVLSVGPSSGVEHAPLSSVSGRWLVLGRASLLTDRVSVPLSSGVFSRCWAGHPNLRIAPPFLICVGPCIPAY